MSLQEESEEGVVARLSVVLFGELFAGPILVSCGDWLSIWQASKEVARCIPVPADAAVSRTAKDMRGTVRGLAGDPCAKLVLAMGGPGPQFGALVVPVSGGEFLAMFGQPSCDSRWARVATVVGALRIMSFPEDSPEWSRFEVLRDVYNLARRLGEAEALRTVDQDTGLLNRAAFLALVDQAIARNRRDGRPFTIALLDVEFPQDPEQSGWQGEPLEVLRYVGRILAAAVRREDHVARVGPSRFACLFLGGNGQESPAALDRIRRNLRRAGLAGAKGVRVVAGAATCYGTLSSPIDAMNNAETMLILERQRGNSSPISS